MKVRSFGRIADFLGRERELDIEEACTVAELRARLAALCPEAAQSLRDGRLRACVDDTLVPDSYLLTPADSVEFLAPVSGG